MYDFLMPLERAERGSTTERVYAALRDAIVHRLLKPGELIDKNLVCERLGVSRFPVSEALGRLGQQGFAEVLPQRGTRVSRIRLQDVRQNLLIRRALEAETVGELARRADAALLERIAVNVEAQRAMLDGAESGAFYELDLEFHAILQEALGYPRVTSTIDAARAGLDRVRRMLGSLHRHAITFGEHALVADAIRTGDAGLAADAMRRHIDSVTTHLADFAAEHPDMFSRDGA
ncbi:MAG: GntR family transcriptional regulator [Mesorhizobium sp.]|nr:GntR family transcriptional regulator [Mesorhizobium sp.]